MAGTHSVARLVYYIKWPGFHDATTRPLRDVDPSRLVHILASRTRAKTLPQLAGHLGMLEPSENTSYDDAAQRVLCNVDRYHTATFALHLARAIVERFELACSYSRMQHALLAHYHPELANAWRPSAVS